MKALANVQIPGAAGQPPFGVLEVDSRRPRAFRPADRALQAQPVKEPSPDRVAVADALAQLPADQRRAIVLYHLCDLSVAEVADEVGSPTGTVKARLSRGRATLARLLNPDVEVRHA